MPCRAVVFPLGSALRWTVWFGARYRLRTPATRPVLPSVLARYPLGTRSVPAGYPLVPGRAGLCGAAGGLDPAVIVLGKAPSSESMYSVESRSRLCHPLALTYDWYDLWQCKRSERLRSFPRSELGVTTVLMCTHVQELSTIFTNVKNCT